MPGLTVFNRRWFIASDDLVIPFGISLLLRGAWLVVVAVVFGIHITSNHDKQKSASLCKYQMIHIYFFVYMGILFLSAVNDLIITYISSRGTIFDSERRKHIPKLLYIRLAILIFEAAWAGVGIHYIFNKGKICFDNHDAWLPQAVVIFNLIWVVFSLLSMYLTFDSAGKLWYKLDKKTRRKKYGSVDTLEFQRKIVDKYESEWHKTCKLLFCCTKTETSKDNVLLLASRIFAEYFHSYTDLVPSDILAGMILLRQRQKYQECKWVEEELKNTNASYHQVTRHKSHKSVRRHQQTVSSYPFDMEDESDVKILEEVTYFAKYALACYGWPMYCLLNNIPLCTRPGCRLLARVRCCHCCRETPSYYPNIAGDNCCLCNYATQKAYLDINNDNFIYVSYSDEVFQTPFNVIVDNFKESIVISCRGTLSLQDILTDLAIEEENIPGGDPEWTAHKGFLQAAVAIQQIIEEKQLLEEAKNFDVNKGSQNYKLVIVGHSLGAGTASILAFLMRPKYPDLQCYAYGPSGSAVSYEAACYAKDFVHSVVLGKDIVSRLNLHTLNELQHNILQMLEKTKLPKWKILHGCICQCILCCTQSSNHSYTEYFETEEEILDFEPYNPPEARQLYMAGKIVHICKTKSIYPRFRKKKAAYQAYWSSAEDFQNILISNLMLRDHFPDTLIEALTSVLPDDIVEVVPVIVNDDDTSVWIVPPDIDSPDETSGQEESANILGPESPSLLELN